jgi:hypothetical protein
MNLLRTNVNSLSHTKVGVPLPPARRQAQRLVIDEWVLGTIFSFMNLIKFKLTMKAAFALNDLHMKEMVAAWPRRLRSLQLGSLCQVGANHPESHSIVSIDVSSTSLPPLSMITPQHVNKRITYLHVGDSYFVSGDLDAQFVHDLFVQSHRMMMVQTASCTGEDVPRVEWGWSAWLYTVRMYC